MLIEQRLHRKLATAVRRLKAAQEHLQLVTEVEQEACGHERIAEVPYRHSDYGSSFKPRRICLSCGYEEEGSVWSGGSLWSKFDHTAATLGNEEDRNIIEVSRDEFYSFRLPQ